MDEDGKKGHPCWRYRRTASGKISAQIFDSNNVPPGWVDSPAKCKKPVVDVAVEPAAESVEVKADEAPKPRRGRPKRK
jgi:hypothetical protein